MLLAEAGVVIDKQFLTFGDFPQAYQYASFFKPQIGFFGVVEVDRQIK